MSNLNPGSEFGDDYYNSLQELTFNSRPIIESRTVLAQENSIYASNIVSAIERRIEKAIPNQKLFTLYLMDSISKNVGLPYTTLFSKNLLKTFTRTYSLVDDPTRVKLIKLFKTWKVPTALTGLPLFDSNQLDQIEQFLIKATANNNINTPTPPKQNSQPLNNIYINPVNDDPRMSLIREIENLTNMVNSRLIGAPNDEKALQRFNLLNQLKSILLADANLPLPQLDSVKQQLQSIRNDEMMKLNVLKQIQMKQQQQQFSTAQLQSLLGNNSPSQVLQHPVSNGVNTANAQALFSMMSSIAKKKSSPQIPNPSLQQMPASMNALFSGGNSNKPTPSPAPTSSFKGSLGLNDLSFLQNILSKAGSTPPILDPSASSSTTPPMVPSQSIDFGFIQPNKEQLLSQFILTESFIVGHLPNEAEIGLLHVPDSNQCSNCARRFPNTPEGRSGMQHHLDWHFRINKKQREVSGSGNGGVVNRSWYMTSEEWIEFNDDVIDNEHGTENQKENDMSNFRDNRDEMSEKEINDHIVQIPSGAANEIICDICRDTLHGVFDEDIGEWIWRGAIESRGQIRHYQCDIETKRRERSPTRN